MNETIETIRQRRSIRHYSAKAIPGELLDLIVECGQLAPSGRGGQNWHFTVVTDRGVLDQITAANREMMLSCDDPTEIKFAEEPDFDNFRTAPAAIIVSVDDSQKWSMVDCANAMTTMAIAAQSLGLSSCYIVSFARAVNAPKHPELPVLLQIPDGWRAQFALCLGYGDLAPHDRAPRRMDAVNYVGPRT